MNGSDIGTDINGMYITTTSGRSFGIWRIVA